MRYISTRGGAPARRFTDILLEGLASDGASPLQLSFDPQLLEAVGVRPGRFFGGDASFSYRVDTAGSIFIGASGSGSVASDAELVILTFKPIRPAAATEVKISSLQLHGAPGKSIAVEPVSAYRTSITP